MAKGDKSEAIPGGTKASDLPASVGGTKVAESTPAPPASAAAPAPPSDTRPATPADVQATAPTDAASTKVPPNDYPKSEPGTDSVPSGFVGPRMPAKFGRFDRTGRLSGAALSADSGEPDISVMDFVQLNKQFIADLRAKNWSAAFKDVGAIANVFSDLMDSGGFKLFGTTAADAAALESAKGMESELRSARAEVMPHLAGDPVAWDGSGNPHPLSGSPAPAAAPQVSGAVDPATILVLIELAQKLWALFRSRQT